jgi:uncharacterized protein (TIGR02246 family)
VHKNFQEEDLMFSNLVHMLLRRTLCFLVVPLIAACASQPNVTTVDAAAQVYAATDAWRAAYDSRDPTRIVAMYGSGAVFWGTTMKSIATTPAAIAEYFKDARNRPNARVVFTEQHVRVYGDIAMNSGAYTFKDARDGQEIANPSRFSMVFGKQDGKWLILNHHSSRVP